MKTKNIFKFYSLLAFLFIVSACTGDLNVIPKDDSEFLAQDFYSNSNAYKQALAGIMAIFH